MRRPLAVFAALIGMGAASAAVAHTAWLERDPAQRNVWRLFFGGHEGRLETADPAKLRDVTALDARGRPLPLRRIVSGTDVRVQVTGTPALLALHYDNGIRSRTSPDGPTVERPMTEAPGAVSAVWPVKYGKFVAQWGPLITRPLGQPFEVVAMSPEAPRAGQPLRVQVRQDGRPAAGVSVGQNEDTATAFTDANGVATYTPTRGLNRLWAGRRIPVSNDPRYTQLSYEYLFVFEAR